MQTKLSLLIFMVVLSNAVCTTLNGGSPFNPVLETESAQEDSVSVSAPSYPLFGIVNPIPSISNPDDLVLTGEELFEPLGYYRGLYRRDSRFLRNIMKGVRQYQPHVKVIRYMHGYYNSQNVADVIERDYLHGIAMTDVTTLASDLDASSSTVYVEIPAGGKLPILASTADVSDPNDSKKFCLWIRVNDEKMQVLEVDSNSGMLKVKRGFYSTTPVSHAKETRVMVPMYHQEPNKGNGLRYILDPAHEDAARYKTEKEILNSLQLGYDGVWLDNFMVLLFGLLDPLGSASIPWDFRNGRRYTKGEDFAEVMYTMLVNIRNNVTEERGPGAGSRMYIGANQWLGNNYLRSNQILPRNARPDGLDAVCMEDLFVDPNRETGTKHFSGHPIDLWLTNMNAIRQAAHDGSHAIAMITAAGTLSQHFNPVDQPNYEELDRFGWCAYLLAVTPEKTISFGRPVVLWEKNSKLEFIPLGEHYFLPIGNPAEDKEIANYAVGSSGAYARRFENAVVFVNPESSPVTVPLTGALNDVADKLDEPSFELKAWDGKIVMLDNHSNVKQHKPLSYSVYPNPADEFVNLKTDFNPGKDHSYELFNVTGKLIEKGLITGNETRISLNGFADGIYCLYVNRNTQKPQIIRLVKK